MCCVPDVIPWLTKYRGIAPLLTRGAAHHAHVVSFRAKNAKGQFGNGLWRFLLSDAQMTFFDGFAPAILVNAFERSASLQETHLHVLLEVVDLAGFQDQAGGLRVFGLRTEAMRSRIKHTKKIIFASVAPDPFPFTSSSG